MGKNGMSKSATEKSVFGIDRDGSTFDVTSLSECIRVSTC